MNIFVGNLNSATTPEAIRGLFALHGRVRRLKLMTDNGTGVFRGFAFVEMGDVEAEPAIAALNGSTFDGRTIDVHPGRPRLHKGRVSSTAHLL